MKNEVYPRLAFPSKSPLEAQSPMGRLEKWRPETGLTKSLTKTGVLELLTKIKNFPNFPTPNPQSQQSLVCFLWTSVQASTRTKKFKESARE